MKERTCKERWAEHKDSRMSDLRKLWKVYQLGGADSIEHKESSFIRKTVDEIGTFEEYGLAFDYVAPGTFEKQREGYWRYQISYGGPSEEFRFYSSSPTSDPYRITFCFMDWFDGYNRKLRGKDEELMLEIWNFFSEVGSTEAEYDKAMEA